MVQLRRSRLVPDMPAGGWRGWLGPVLAMLAAAALRIPGLGNPRAVVFDETYYMKDALSLLLFGHEQQSIKGADQQILDSTGDPQSLAHLYTGEPSFVVHPPIGKWVIASGEHFFGVTPFGWRIAVAILGIASVLILARIVRRLTRSNLIGSIAGLLLALDGLAIVMSRTALLDGSLMFFALSAFGFLLLDRDQARRRLADRLGDGFSINPAAANQWLGIRWWRVAAGVSLGLACGVKWSGIYFIAAFGLLTALWDVGMRRTAGSTTPWRTALVRDALPAFVSIVVVAVCVYLLTWSGWFLSSNGWDRQWAAENEGLSGAWAALVSLWHFHVEAWNFNVGLTTPHSYQSNPWGWPLMTRPTSFYYESPKGVCSSSNCAQEVLGLGNPLIWWAGTLALFHQAWRWAARRDWRSGAVLCGFLAGWLPWLFFQERTIFTFYAIVFTPFLIAALALSLGTIIGPTPAPNDEAAHARRVNGGLVAGAFLVLVVAISWWFFPVWTGQPINYSDWMLRMWFPTWI